VYIEATIITSVRFFSLLIIIGNREFLVPILVGSWRLQSSGSELVISLHVSDPLIVPSVYEERMIGTYGYLSNSCFLPLFGICSISSTSSKDCFVRCCILQSSCLILVGSNVNHRRCALLVSWIFDEENGTLNFAYLDLAKLSSDHLSLQTFCLEFLHMEASIADWSISRPSCVLIQTN
jgi:hypothetical protein